jgi:hypothetical protein
MVALGDMPTRVLRALAKDQVVGKKKASWGSGVFFWPVISIKSLRFDTYYIVSFLITPSLLHQVPYVYSLPDAYYTYRSLHR